MIKVIRAFDTQDSSHVFSIMVTDKGFSYIFKDDKNPMFNSAKRVELLMSKIDKDPKTLKIDDYLSIATIGLSNFFFSAPMDESSEKTAVTSEKLAMQRVYEADQGRDVGVGLAIASDDIDQVFQDYPELYEQLASEDPEQEITASGMIELVFAALGSVDPNGPNAWLLDYMDGQTADGFVGDIVFDAQPGTNESGKK
jgi:hypothetical protein